MSYTLHYFNYPGRAERARLLFRIGGVEFTDAIIERAQWPSIKPHMPFGQLPVLDVDGKLLAESGAIDRYVAKLVNLYPDDPWEAALADQAYEFGSELSALFNEVKGLTPDERRSKCIAIVAGPLQEKLMALSKLLAGKDYIAGGTLNFGDVALFIALSALKSGILDGVPKDILEAHPSVKDYRNRIANHPVVKDTYKDCADGMRAAFKADR